MYVQHFWVDVIKQEKHITHELLYKLLKLPVNIIGNGSNFRLMFRICVRERTNDINFLQKLNLFFNLHYDLYFKLTPISEESYSNLQKTEDDTFIDLRKINHMYEPLDDVEKYLIEGLKDVIDDKIIDGFPKLVMWCDKFVKKNASGFCERLISHSISSPFCGK